MGRFTKNFDFGTCTKFWSYYIYAIFERHRTKFGEILVKTWKYLITMCDDFEMIVRLSENFEKV